MRARKLVLASLLVSAALGSLGLFLACGVSYRAASAPDAFALRGAFNPNFNTEDYDPIHDNPFLAARDNPLSTFSVDVDTASYANVRRFLMDGQWPPADAVRVEELVNYFRYDYAEPEGDDPVAVDAEVGPCPWQSQHRLVRIGLRARSLAPQKLPPRSLTFLLDVSGSMDDPRKLPLLKRAFGLLVDTLTAHDQVAIAVYAGASGLVLPPTRGDDQDRIRGALESLHAGGSTNGAGGIELAYAVAGRMFVPGGVNRVILATDGDFNVGVSSRGELERLIESKRDTGVYLTVLGFGMGNLKDGTLEALANRGNGNHAYIDSFTEARRVLVEDVAGTLVTVAKDVKVQVELNPATVASYRLIGYENRLLRKEDFANDQVDAAEMGAGQTVTALYEVTPAHGVTDAVIPLRYQKTAALAVAAASGELATVKLRYQLPSGGPSHELALPVRDREATLAQTSTSFRLAAAVAAFGLALRDSPHKGNATLELVRELWGAAARNGGDERQREFAVLLDKSQALRRRSQ
jgi:Ca-activated chloride channel family protein